jgi:3-methylcrotonyl-CoA carboxylase alpha subunit
MNPIQTLLIANRGEISVRIIKSAREMGIRTVAVFAEADRNSLHVKEADSAIFLGEGPVNQTYLVQQKIIDAMKKSGADAVHPGYGFLSEDAGFAERVINEGFIWVGPPVAAMNAMASKANAKKTLQPKGVPMIPGYHGDLQDDETLRVEAQKIGLPLLVKASAGGGGKGMKVVTETDALNDAIDSARREAKNSFGDDRLLLEKYLVKPRHIEIQIMADLHGNVVSLFERDCSIQRRHQKVLEEAPAVNLPETVRQAMWLAAETAAKEIGYAGAGTVEFILSATGEFFFLEMNTRLQVEHPVTELITGLDLVEWQLRVAQGEILNITKPDVPLGHAIEVRLYAEDPSDNFAPMVGELRSFSYPVMAGLRVDTGIESSASVSSFYDPMLAKIIVHGSDRNSALQKMRRALSEIRCQGLTTNLSFLRQLTKQKTVIENTVYTRWLDDFPEFYQADQLTSLPSWSAIASVAKQLWETKSTSWSRHAGWRMDGRSTWQFAVSEQDSVNVIIDKGTWSVTQTFGEQTHSLTASNVLWHSTAENSGRLSAEVDGHLIEWDVLFDGDKVWLDNGDRIESITWWKAEKAHDTDIDSVGHAVAVLPGTVTAVYKKQGESVIVGDKLLSFEAMKMETTLTAEVAGTLDVFTWQEGDQISEGDILFNILVELLNGDSVENEKEIVQ